MEPRLGDKFNNDSKFIYQGCSCSAGYTGRFCENDIDACVLNGQPCFKDVNCTDQPAPANITGYSCGPCPSGYSGDGVKCVGKSRMCMRDPIFFFNKDGAYVLRISRYSGFL